MSAEESAKTQKIRSATIIFIARDHQEFIPDCITSAKREFPEPTQVIFLDAGSQDTSTAAFSNSIRDSNFNCSYIYSDRSDTTLENVAKAIKEVTTSHFILISCDDAFGSNYGATVQKLLSEDVSEKTVFNFTLEICDLNLKPTGIRGPNWSNRVELNKRRLSLGNPGTTAGALFPTEATSRIFRKNQPLESLIEDYWIWWNIVETIKFRNVTDATVLYRKHHSSTSQLRNDRRYIKSLAQAASLPLIMPNKTINKILSLTLVPRWIRHIKLPGYPIFIREYLNSARQLSKK
jgi:hypothetical protein